MKQDLDELEQILVDVVLGRDPPKTESPHSSDIRKEFVKEVEEIKRDGKMVEIPGGFP